MKTFLRKLGHMILPSVFAGVVQQARSKYHGFSVEFYPLTNVYYAKYGRLYMKRHYQTGVIELLSNDHLGILYGKQHHMEEDAWHTIDLFIEQQHKENVRTITR